MAKRRIYSIAKDRGMTTQELAEQLRSAGLEFKSNLSSVEESEVERVLSAEKAAPTDGGKAAVKPKAKTSKTKTDSVDAEPASAAEPKASAAEPKASAAEPKAPAAEAVEAETKAEPAKSESAKPADAKAEPAKTSAKAAAKPAPSSGARKDENGGSGPRRVKSIRNEDRPTVAAPDVPMRKGVKASGNVLRKGEEHKVMEQKRLEQKAAQAAAAQQRQAKTETPPAKQGQGSPPPRTSRPTGTAPAQQHTEEAEGRKRPAARTRPTTTSPAPAAGGRPRRGAERSTRRRVVIDSQAGRKGGKPSRGAKGDAAHAEPQAPVKVKPAPGTESPVELASGATVKDLAEALQLAPSELIMTMMKMGEMVTITQSLSDEAMEILASEFERQVIIKHAEEETGEPVFEDAPEDLKDRAPVVTIMGHVDHGKTSLLDAIRTTEVAAGEAGGITQHIGAYQVRHGERPVTFIDTPGHEAFTAMRARGAKVTDIAVIVVAANDGVMPQTVEAIDHAKAAEVPMVVAINKMDLADSNPDRVKQQLSDQGLVPEDWGGDTVMVPVSAKQATNLDELMDMLLLVADVQELKANPESAASGVIVEAELDVGRGPVATMLVQRGTLKVGDALWSGEAYGKVKAMFDFKGEEIKEAGPSVPVQILGFDTVPDAGDYGMVVKDEREARHKAEKRTSRLRMEQQAKGGAGATSLDDFYARLKEGEVKELNLVLKADVGGSAEALQEALQNVSHPEVKVRVIHSGVGGVNESDIMLAAASNAVVIGFNVRPSIGAKNLAEQEGVDVRTYRVIYKAIEDVEAALVGMLEPDMVEEELGTVEVRQTFRSSKIGTIAGGYVQTGKITRNAKVRIVRDGSIVYEGSLSSLKRFQEDAREVLAGYECGLVIDGYDDVKEGDMIEAFEIREVARTA